MDKFVKPRRNRRKIVSNTGTALWTPKGDFRWCSAAGQSVLLTETNLSALSNPERRALQRLALLKLQTLSIQCTIPSYKGEVKQFGKRLRRSLKGRKLKNAETGSTLLGRFVGGKDRSTVFATPLNVVIKNDRLAAAGVSPIPRQTRRKSEPLTVTAEGREKVPRKRRVSHNTPPATSALKRQQMKQSKSYSALQKNSVSTSSLKSATYSIDGDFEKPKRHSDSDSVLISHLCPEQGKRVGWKSRLLDALTLSSTSASASCLMEKPELPLPSPPKVPSIVVQSIKHLEKHGLHALGIFRVAGSKKRLKQLRDEFDSGLRETFSEEDNAHDVAALFKEFLRCLPEPLMTRELYTAFLSTQRFKDTEMQLNALKYLWYLLPDSNRDTLHCLLCFLSKVARYAEDTTDENDLIVPGNKMNCRNLATLMGPNILHKVKSPHLQSFVVENVQRAEEHDEVIDVTEDLINYHEELSTVSPEMHDQVMRLLLQTEPETVDFILRHKVKSHLGEDIENIVKGSSDIINEIDDKETNARLQHRVINNVYDLKKGTSRAHSVPPSNRQFILSDNAQTHSRFHHRCASTDEQFVKTFGLSPCNCSVAQGECKMRKQRSYANSEPETPKMNTSVSFSYFPSSPILSPRTASMGNSPESSPSYSPTDVTYHDCRMHNHSTAQNGNSLSIDDTLSMSKSRGGESDITSEDFYDIDMRNQWLEWEALSKKFNYDADFLDQETLV